MEIVALRRRERTRGIAYNHRGLDGLRRVADDGQGGKGGVDVIVAKAPELLKKYPRDPRAHLYQAIGLVEAKNLAGAEQEIRVGLSDKDMLRVLFTPATKVHLESYLALILTDEHRKAEATESAKAGCLDSSAPLHPALVKAGLCEMPKP